MVGRAPGGDAAAAAGAAAAAAAASHRIIDDHAGPAVANLRLPRGEPALPRGAPAVAGLLPPPPLIGGGANEERGIDEAGRGLGVAVRLIPDAGGVACLAIGGVAAHMNCRSEPQPAPMAAGVAAGAGAGAAEPAAGAVAGVGAARSRLLSPLRATAAPPVA